jgi:hypothetical protein
LERTHDLIDGLLTSEVAERARAHLAQCADCRERHARIAELVVDLRALPTAATPPGDLWTGIGQRIDGSVPRHEPVTADVLEFPGAAPAPRRVSFTIPQLAAASVALAFFSAGALWLATARPASAPVPTEATASSATGARFAADEAAYDVALDELLAIVETVRPGLAPETVIALDQSLAEIDAAIQEIADALESDPASELLQGMLVSQQRSKLRVLRQVATRSPTQL